MTPNSTPRAPGGLPLRASVSATPPTGARTSPGPTSRVRGNPSDSERTSPERPRSAPAGGTPISRQGNPSLSAPMLGSSVRVGQSRASSGGERASRPDTQAEAQRHGRADAVSVAPSSDARSSPAERQTTPTAGMPTEIHQRPNLGLIHQAKRPQRAALTRERVSPISRSSPRPSGRDNPTLRSARCRRRPGRWSMTAAGLLPAGTRRTAFRRVER